MTANLNLDKIVDGFLRDLSQKGISPMSISNYKSDLNTFENWLKRKLKLLGVFPENLEDCIPFINLETGAEYKKHLTESNTNTSSLNRKLSTLRQFSRFLLAIGVLEFDFTSEIKNITSPHLQKLDLEVVSKEFRKFLEGEKVTKNTIKNYLSDVKHFINWFNNNNFGGPLND